ncbi:hypothetical protein AMTRI_Chr08g204550 [Amborella trichopoda]
MAMAFRGGGGVIRRLLSSSPFPFSSPVSATPPNPPAVPSTSLFVSARVVTDRVSGYSKGFGFVRYATLEEAEAGIKGMDGQFLDGWVIFAEYARPKTPGASEPRQENPI